MTNQIDVNIIVDGQKHSFTFNAHETAESSIAKIVHDLHLNRPPADYELRFFSTGQPLNLNQSLAANGVTSGTVLVLGPQAGVGG